MQAREKGQVALGEGSAEVKVAVGDATVKVKEMCGGVRGH